MWHVSGHYADINSLLADQAGGHRATVKSISADHGHYSVVHSIIAGCTNVDGYDQCLDTDQVNTVSAEGDTNPSDGSRGGLDPPVLATLRQPQRPDATQQTTEQIEMTANTDQQNTVSRHVRVKPNTLRRRRRDQTVGSRRVGGVNTPVGSRDPVYNFLW